MNEAHPIMEGNLLYLAYQFKCSIYHIYTMEFYTAERKKELLPFATAWMELESIMLSEISQAVRDKYHMISDADPGQQDPLWLLYSNTHTHRLQKSCGEKGAAWPLSKLKRGPLTPTWTGLYCFSGHITLRVILIYYAQVHHR